MPTLPAVGDSTPRSVAALFQQAAYWRAQNRPERVLTAMERILAVMPDNVDALSIAVESAALTSSTDRAQVYFNRLRALAPLDPRTTRAEVTLLVASEGAADLAEARRLAAAGQRDQALVRYRSLFRNNAVPGFLANEYYSIYSEVNDATFDESAAALQRLSAAAPSDLMLKLAYARLLTYREWRRSDGIQLLQELARNPAIATAARAALREAILWEADAPDIVPLLDDLLRTYPRDPELTSKRSRSEELMRPMQRVQSWSLIAENRYAEAEAQLNALIAEDPNDTASMMAMIFIRAKQGRRAEAQALIRRAIEISPDLQSEIEGTLVAAEGPGRFATGGGGRGGGGNFLPATTLARQALAANNLDRADRLARQAQRSSPAERAEAEIILGQIALRREEPLVAEQRFRAALALRPNVAEAQTGLYFVLQAQNRFAEAEALQRSAGFATPAGAGAARAFAIRDEAARVSDDTAAAARLREALALDPGNVWVRLDLVRRLRTAGQSEQAKLVEAQLTASNEADALSVAALLANDEDRFGDAVALLERVPTRLRSADSTRLLALARAETQARQLEQQARAGDARARAALVALVARPDPSGSTTPLVVRAFSRLNDRPSALAAARGGILANPRATAGDRVNIAAALFDANEVAEAERLLDGMDRNATLSAEDRRQVTFLRERAAVQRADRLNDARDPAAAYEQLAPHLRGPGAASGSAQVRTALMRLYARNNRFAEARAIADELLARDPMDADIRASAVDLAVQMEEYGVAEGLLAEGRRYGVSSVNLLQAEARVARARRNPVREMRALEAATRLQLQALRVGGQDQQLALVNELVSPRRAGTQPLTELADPATAQLLRELSRARDEAAIWLQAGLGVNGRTGAAGLSRATTFTAPVELSVPVTGLQGRLQVQTGAVVVQAGRLSPNAASLRQFGTNPLANGGPLARPDERQAGAPVALAYVGERVRVDVGTTPLGFRRTNVVGGVEVLLPVGERVGVRLTGERRAITNSLLSYGGLRDPLTGRTWGAPTRDGGRLQVEVAGGPDWGAYASVGGAYIGGEGVRGNRVLEAGGGLYRTLVNTPAQTVSLGVNYRHTAYDRSLGGFTLGQGGYFSPQNSNAVAVQADIRRQTGDWTLRATAAVGWQWYRTSASPVFPGDRGLQSQLEALAANDPGLLTINGSQKASGPTGSLALNAEYALSADWRVGAAGQFSRTGDFQDLGGLLYLRYRIDRARTDASALLAAAPRAYPYPSYPFAGGNSLGRPEPVSLSSGASRPVW